MNTQLLLIGLWLKNLSCIENISDIFQMFKSGIVQKIYYLRRGSGIFKYELDIGLLNIFDAEKLIILFKLVGFFFIFDGFIPVVLVDPFAGDWE